MKASDVALALREVYDPELGIDIVSLGLLYDIEVEPDAVRVTMSMTTPNCPMAAAIAHATETKLDTISEGRGVEVQVVHNPPWNVGMLNADARKWLGLPEN